jgi:O-antigen ligase
MALTAVFCLITGYLIIRKFELLAPLLDYFRTLNLDPSGREEIFQTGMALFREHWLFGAGSYSGMTYLAPYDLYTYHNYWIHTLATTGVIGLIAFVYYLIMILKSCFVKNRYNILVLFSVLVILIHGLVDNTFYNPKIMLFLSVILPLLVQNKREQIVEIINLPDHSQA